MTPVSFTNRPQGFEFSVRAGGNVLLSLNSKKNIIHAKFVLHKVEILGYYENSYEVEWLTDLLKDAAICVIFGREGYFKAGEEILIANIDYHFKTGILTVDITTE